VNDALDGEWIAGSEERVGDRSAEFGRRAFEEAMQRKIAAAEAGFPPSSQSFQRQAPGE
jgi:hypothetical protein